jgi:hypothetical protein
MTLALVLTPPTLGEVALALVLSPATLAEMTLALVLSAGTLAEMTLALVLTPATLGEVALALVLSAGTLAEMALVLVLSMLAMLCSGALAGRLSGVLCGPRLLVLGCRRLLGTRCSLGSRGFLAVLFLGGRLVIAPSGLSRHKGEQASHHQSDHHSSHRTQSSSCCAAALAKGIRFPALRHAM